MNLYVPFPRHTGEGRYPDQLHMNLFSGWTPAFAGVTERTEERSPA
jgi:hypothetical protein